MSRRKRQRPDASRERGAEPAAADPKHSAAPTADGGAANESAAPTAPSAAPEAPPVPGLVGRRPVHRGRIVDLSIDTVRFPDGSLGELELIRHSGAAAVLPLLSDPTAADPVVLLVRQYRYAAGGYMLEVPAGRPDREGEAWETCAQRELQEEAGVVAGHLTYLTMIYTTPGFTDERIHLFLATDLQTAPGKLDDDEFIEPVTMPLSQALEKIRDGEITDAKTIVTLLYAAGFLLGHG